MRDHLEVEVLRGGRLQRVAVEPVRHLLVSSNFCPPLFKILSYLDLQAHFFVGFQKLCLLGESGSRRDIGP